MVGSCDDSESAGVTFNSVALNLGEVAEEGVYTCIVQDELGVEQKLFIGVYQSGWSCMLQRPKINV